MVCSFEFLIWIDMDLDIGGWTKKGNFDSLSSGKSPSDLQNNTKAPNLTNNWHLSKFWVLHSILDVSKLENKKNKFEGQQNSAIPVMWGTNGSQISKDKIRQRGDQIGNHIMCHNTFVGARLLELPGDTHTWPHCSFSLYHHLLPHFQTHPPLPFSFCSLQSLI